MIWNATGRVYIVHRKCRANKLANETDQLENPKIYLSDILSSREQSMIICSYWRICWRRRRRHCCFQYSKKMVTGSQLHTSGLYQLHSKLCSLTELWRIFYMRSNLLHCFYNLFLGCIHRCFESQPLLGRFRLKLTTNPSKYEQFISKNWQTEIITNSKMLIAMKATAISENSITLIAQTCRLMQQ